LRTDVQLVLQVGLDMPIPITDLTVDDRGIGATLSFQRSPHYCFAPWDSVFGLLGDQGHGMVWPEDLPPELVSEVVHEAARSEFTAFVPGSMDDEDVALDAPSKIRSTSACRLLRLIGSSAPPPATASSSSAASASRRPLEAQRSPVARTSKAPVPAETKANNSSRPPYLRLVK